MEPIEYIFVFIAVIATIALFAFRFFILNKKKNNRSNRNSRDWFSWTSFWGNNTVNANETTDFEGAGGGSFGGGGAGRSFGDEFKPEDIDLDESATSFFDDIDINID